MMSKRAEHILYRKLTKGWGCEVQGSHHRYMLCLDKENRRQKYTTYHLGAHRKVK